MDALAEAAATTTTAKVYDSTTTTTAASTPTNGTNTATITATAITAPSKTTATTTTAAIAAATKSATTTTTTTDSIMLKGILEDILISNIVPTDNQLRVNPEVDQELVLSIKNNGLLHPVLVRPRGDGQFELVAGHRRYLACKALHWRKIPCQIVDLNDKEAFEVSLIENIQRRTLNPLEEARAFKTYVSKFGWGSESELAQRVGKSSSYIAKRIKLLELPPDILVSLRDLTISPSMAEELLIVKDKDQQSKLADLIRRRHLSTKKVRELLKDIEYEDEAAAVTADFDILNPRRDDPRELETRQAKRAMDKSIILLKVAMNKLALVIESVEENWLAYEILMQHKNMLHEQIDILIKEKRKYNAPR
jgi:ParB family chromosome partitioning protein